MKYWVVLLMAFIIVWAAGSVQGALIEYQLSDLGNQQWEYAYRVVNNHSEIEPIKSLTIWFETNAGQFEIVSGNSIISEWDEAILHDVVGRGHGYDLLAKDEGIGPGDDMEGFAVRFKWNSAGQPGSQFYEVLDPDDFSLIESGYTVPEPNMMVLGGVGMVIGFIKRRLAGR